MTSEEFIELFFRKAKENGAEFKDDTTIQCPNKKVITKEILKTIFDNEGENSYKSKSCDLKSYKLQTCCHIIFRIIAQSIVSKNFEFNCE
jgi:hypothetical protein